MLDERWSEDVEEIATALRKMLAVQSSSHRVRKAEASEDGRDRALEAELDGFGLNTLQAEPELFARIAFELGRSLAPCAYVESIPVLALTGRAGISLAFDRPVPAANTWVAVQRDGSVFIEPLRGQAQRTAAGDYVVLHRHDDQGTNGAECIGDAAMADRLLRYASLAEAARLVGAGQALLAHGVAYASERTQFGKIIGTYQGVAHRLSRAAGALDAAELLVRKSAFTALGASGGDGAPSAAFALMVRAKASEAAQMIATDVHQVFGGTGFAVENDVQLYSRRLRNWAGRCGRNGTDLAALGRMVLDPAKRASIRLLWHFDSGIKLPRWALEADGIPATANDDLTGALIEDSSRDANRIS
jgi:acyl-CoA dehydrogenase-like protein